MGTAISGGSWLLELLAGSGSGSVALGVFELLAKILAVGEHEAVVVLVGDALADTDDELDELLLGEVLRELQDAFPHLDLREAPEPYRQATTR